MLHGRGTGGLQVLPPGSTEWQWIRPIRGHAVCNVGDTLCSFDSARTPTTKTDALHITAVFSGGLW